MERINIGHPRFENYEWGAHITTVKNMVIAKGHELIDDGDKSGIVEYEDKILDKEVNIKLCFTFESRKLYLISLLWYDSPIRKALFKILTSKYGEPQSMGKMGWYKWKRDRYLLDIINASFEDKGVVRMHYQSDDYCFIHIKEATRAEYGEDVDRF